MKVTIYTTPDCPYSKEEKEYLTAKGVQYDEKDVSNDKDNLSEMLDLSNKFAGVPFSVVVKNSGEKVMLKGFTKADFDSVLSSESEAPGQADAVPAEVSVSPAVADSSLPPLQQMPDPAMPAMPQMPDQQPVMPAAPVAPVMPMPDIPNLSIPVVPAPSPVVPTPSIAPQAPMGMPQAPFGDPQSPMGMPTPSMSMPQAPSVAPQAPTAPEPADPQDELSGLLKDLEAKVSSQAPAPTAPADVQTPPSQS